MKEFAKNWAYYQKYWLLLPQDPEKCFQGLLPIFKKAANEKDNYNAFLFWPLLIKAIAFSWDDFKKLDPYIKWYEQNPLPAGIKNIPEFLFVLKSSYFLALFLRNPESPCLEALQKELLGKLSEIKQPETKAEVLFALSWRAFWQGDLLTLALLADELAITFGLSPGVEVIKAWIQAGKALWVHNDVEKAQKFLHVAHQKADKQGIFIWKHLLYAFECACALFEEQPQVAERYLANMESCLSQTGKHALGHHLYLKGWKCFLTKDFNQADIYLKRALQIFNETGFKYPFYLTCFSLAQVLFSKKQLSESLKYLVACEKFAKKTRSYALLFMIWLHKAYLAFLSGDKTFGLFFLKRALGIGNQQNYLHLLWWHNPKMLSFVMANALEHNICIDYAKQLILHHNLPPPTFWNLSHLWPYRLKIYTLGRFAFEFHGKSFQVIRKKPSKPLELLSILVAVQGEVDKSYLLDILWPETEADAAYHSLETTIYRLRKILGAKDLVKSLGRTVSLNTESCYVDIWELKNKLEKIKKAIRRKAATEAFLLTEEVLDLYDEFLPGYHSPSIIYERKILAQKTTAIIFQALQFLKKSFPKETLLLHEKASSLLGQEFSDKIVQLS